MCNNDPVNINSTSQVDKHIRSQTIINQQFMVKRWLRVEHLGQTPAKMTRLLYNQVINSHLKITYRLERNVIYPARSFLTTESVSSDAYKSLTLSVNNPFNKGTSHLSGEKTKIQPRLTFVGGGPQTHRA